MITELLQQPDALRILAVLIRYSVNVDNTLEVDDFRQLAQQLPNPKTRQNVMTLAQKLVEEGKDKGRKEGRKEGTKTAKLAYVLRILESRCGKVSKTNHEKISNLSSDQLDALFEAAMEFSSKKEIADWLKQN